MDKKHAEGCIRIAAALFFAAVFALAGPESAWKDQVSFPRTSAGLSVEAYFEAFNAGVPAMREFFFTHTAKSALPRASVEIRVERYRQMKERLGVLRPQKIVASREDFISVVAAAEKGQVVRLEFQFEPSAPYGLLGVRLEREEPEAEGAPPAEPKKDEAGLLAAVSALVDEAVQKEEFSGVVLVAKDGTPVFERAYGLADREAGIPNRVDTRFNIGSINKSFTGLAVLRLAAENKLSLNDPVSLYLADYPNPDVAAKVRVRHLLHMTSGLGDFFGERYEATPKEKIRRLEDYLPLFADKPLEFEPGTREKYSNAGYIVLGLIIQKASGMDYAAFMEERIFKPAGMADTGWIDKDAPLPERAVGYVREGAVLKPNTDTLPGRGSSAGGGYSTARDLLSYTTAIATGILPGDVEKMGQGLALAGGAPGLNAALEWDTRSGYVIIVLSNFGPPSAEKIARQIRAWLPR
ncbi:MAG TPA: serine hydrolase domain-containing protein [Candidatus Aminicenantes bacterium]|nr:serine hydrolase domain-containing protein [Candidatus Aminicenantes bacterium]